MRWLWLAPVVFAGLIGMLAMQQDAAEAGGPWYVAPGGDDGSDCLGSSTPCATMNGAIGKAAAGDLIYVAEGVYTGDGTYVVIIDKDITLSGGWDSSFTSQDGNSTIDGERSRGGVYAGNGTNSTIERFNITFASNGGIENLGTLTINDSTVRWNEQTGIRNFGDMTIDSSIIRDNSGSLGGGLRNWNGPLTIIGSTVSHNVSTDRGGGIISNATLNISNSTLSNNSAANRGGGIFNLGGTSSIHSSTISGNQATDGGGIYRQGGDVTIQNVILGENSASNGPDCVGTIGSAGYNLLGDTSDCDFTSSIGDLTNLAPDLGQLIGSTGAPMYHSLLSESSAIDAGDPGGCLDHNGSPLAADQRGAPCVGICDIGAYEYTLPGSASAVSVVGGSPQRSEPLSEFADLLQAAVLDNVGSPVAGATVNFQAPSSGASGTFEDSGTASTSGVTDVSGVATVAAFTANDELGSYTVNGTVSGIGMPAEFMLTNVHWFVATNGDDGDSCQSASAPCASINGVLGRPDYFPGDTILVAAGTYTGEGNEVVLIDTDTKLLGGWDIDFTTQSGMSIIDGEGERQGVRVYAVTAHMERFVIQNGYTNYGGGVNNFGTLTLSNSAIQNNSAIWNGGGISNSEALYLIGSTVSGNTAETYFGGGIDNSDLLVIDNSTISGNYSDYRGGGIYSSGTLRVSSSTISMNSAPSYGGGIFNNSGSLSIQNSILAENQTGVTPNCINSLESLGYNIIEDPDGCNYTPGPGDLIGINPDIGPLIGLPSYHPLRLGSPAIDAGNPAGCTDYAGDPLAVDQRGAPRVGVCDIGAYEYTAPGPAASVVAIGGTPQRTPPNTTFWHPFEAAVMDSIGTPVVGVTADFLAPSSGPSGAFSDSGSFSTSSVTNQDGIATAVAFTANGLGGAYAVDASVSGVPAPASFEVENLGWYVTPAGDFANDCLTPLTPCPSINAVLFKAGFVPGDTILVAVGTYTGGGPDVVTLDKDVRLLGGWDSAFTSPSGLSVIDGEDARRGMLVGDAVIASVDRFEIRNGFPPSSVGGGIFNQGILSISNCSIVNSRSDFWGGGISSGFFTPATLVMDNCTISGNSGPGGSGGIQGGGSIYVNNSVISGNNGGGVYAYEAEFHSTTIANNIGPGITSTGAISIRNTILAGNQGGSSPDCTGDINSLGYNLVGDTAGCTYAAAAGDILDVDPDLESLTGSPGYHPLGPESPAVNAGNPSGCRDHMGNLLEIDHRGVPRLGVCDIGAYEAQSLKASSQRAATPQDIINFDVTFQNWRDSEEDYSVTDSLPTGLTYVDGSLTATSGSYDFSDGIISWNGSVEAGEAVTISFDAEVGQVLGAVVNMAEIIDTALTETRTATISVDAPICGVTKDANNPVLSIGPNGSWDDGGVWDPSVLRADGTLMMWYTANDGSGPPQIGLATSTDGINWTKDASNPVLSPSETWDTDGVSSPSVLHDGSEFKMWYTGRDSSGVARIGYATSSDGITWTKPGFVVLNIGAADGWEDEDVSGPAVIRDGNTYHMWYAGFDGSTSRVGHATSSDGISWSKDVANPILDVGGIGNWDWLNVYSPAAVKIGDEYKLWYSGGTLPTAWQTGYAVSSDATDWSRKGMFIPEGGTGSFDSSSADHVSVLLDGPGYRIWYSGLDDSGTYSIGYATANICTGGTNTIYLPLIGRDFGGCPALYRDDFGDPASGWPIYSDSNYEYGYTSGEYQIWVKNPFDGLLVTPGARAEDFTVTVEARRTSGAEGAYGIIFGLSDDWNQFYEVAIDQDAYSIWRFSNGFWYAVKDWTASGYINTGTAWNQLKVVREGTAIEFYVNGQHLTTESDGAFTGFRRIGLVAFSNASGPVEARFEDFALHAASCGAEALLPAIEFGESGSREGILPPGLDGAPPAQD